MTRDNIALRRFFVLALVVGGLISASEGRGSAPVSEAEALRLKTIAEGFMTNRQSFPFLTCRFEVSQGAAGSLKEALDSGPSKDVVKAECIWIRDGSKERYELNRPVDREKLMGSVKGEGVPLTLGPHKRVGEGSLVLATNGVLLSGAAYSPDLPPPDLIDTPLDMFGEMGSDGSLHPGRLIPRFLESPEVGTVWPAEAVSLEGQDLLKVVFEASKTRITFFLAPRQGYLPVQMWVGDRDGSVHRKGFITKVRACSSGRWFPERIVLIDGDAKDPTKPCYAREIKVTELDVDRRPADAQFAIEVPAGTQLWDGIDSYSLITLPQTTRFHYSELSGLLAEMRRQAPIRRAREGQIGEPTGPARSRRLVVIGGAALLAVVLGGVVLWRIRARRRHSSAPSP